MRETPRQRATAILIRDDCVLLVRDEGRLSFALPGGGIDAGELPISAVARELQEETTLTATAIRYLFSHNGKYNCHHVFDVEASGEVDVAQDSMVAEFVWWDGSSDVPVHPHVNEILRKAGLMHNALDGSSGLITGT